MEARLPPDETAQYHWWVTEMKKRYDLPKAVRNQLPHDPEYRSMKAAT